MTRTPPSRRNPFTPEAQPILPEVLPTLDAFTFAQIRTEKGQVATLLVTGFWGPSIGAIDLATLGAPPDLDIFDAAAAVGDERLLSASRETDLWARYEVAELLPSGGAFDRHIATGTNFAAHAREAGVARVFHFPKFGPPSPAQTTLVVYPRTLMDYEVEISVRFDRDIRSMDDFTAARKGFFLCGDFTDRATLMRLIDVRDVASGRGFSDAKSGPDYFPTGPFLVVPRDWRKFVAAERIVTRVNGEVRQDARGAAMILDFEALVAKALERGAERAFLYQGKAVALNEGAAIPRGAAVMSGTSEGVLFMPPTAQDRRGGLIDHILRGRFLRGHSPFQSIVERFIRNEIRSRRYLQVGDKVEHLSSSMGALSVDLVAP